MHVSFDSNEGDASKPKFLHVEAESSSHEIMQANCALEKGADRRLHLRTECDWRAIVCLESGEAFDAVAVDASQGGMRLVSEAMVAKGDRIDIELINIGQFFCEVRWTGKRQFGVQFLEAAGEIPHSVVGDLTDYILPEDGIEAE